MGGKEPGLQLAKKGRADTENPDRQKGQFSEIQRNSRPSEPWQEQQVSGRWDGGSTAALRARNTYGEICSPSAFDPAHAACFPGREGPKTLRSEEGFKSAGTHSEQSKRCWVQSCH